MAERFGGRTRGATTHPRDEGRVRHIEVADVPILTNQVRYHPFTDQADVLEFCIDHGVLSTAYRPLAKGAVASDEETDRVFELQGGLTDRSRDLRGL